MKKICFSIAICVQLLIFCSGCEKTDEAVAQDGSYKHIIDKAIVLFDEKNGSQSNKNYDISVRETNEEWIVSFEGKIKYPGNHALVVINKKTEETNYLPGE